MKLFSILIAVAALLAIFVLSPSLAQSAGPSAAPTAPVTVHNLPPLGSNQAFDPQKAVASYLSGIGGAARARSDAYFEGGYVLIAVDALYAVAVSALLLWLKISSRMRGLAQRLSPSRFWQVPIYAVQYLAVTALLTLPLTIYEGFFREQAYGLMNQTFLQWLGDQETSFTLTLIGGVVVLTLIYAAIRRSTRTWWLWGTGIAIAAMAFVMLIGPIFVQPLFNRYTPLPDTPLKAAILSAARANDIPADNVYLVDASRQSDRISANVSGFLGTLRISLNDNLLHKATKDEVLAVLGHEMGHYVLDHGTRLLLLYSLVFAAAFAFVKWGYGRLTGVFGESWDVRTIDDPAGLPVLAALATLFFFVAMPVTNWISRSTEIQADMFGLNAVRKPDAFSTVVLKLSAYRRLDPSPWEETIFYDHPSGRTRIWEAMRWKAEHLNDPDIKAGPQSPQ
ncbi:MAG TPA: M48 family metallopeptidase [Rhizomicrobium sp.]|jgi:STE24 endopeptidase